jgi:hypothetical protein
MIPECRAKWNMAVFVGSRAIVDALCDYEHIKRLANGIVQAIIGRELAGATDVLTAAQRQNHGAIATGVKLGSDTRAAVIQFPEFSKRQTSSIALAA